MDYPSNSDKTAKPEPKKLEKIVTGEIILQKKSLSKRFLETFGGNARGVWGYVFLDVLLPAAKDMVADASTQAVERLVFGESRAGGRRNSRGVPGSNGYVSYNRFGASGSGTRNAETRPVSRRARANHDFDEIILQTRVEAEEVIDRLFDIVSKYDQAAVSDLYDLVGATGNFTDEKWGWTNLAGATVTRVRNGYLLDLPKPEPLD